MDSLDAVEFGMALEDEFEFNIPDEDVQRIKTLGDVMKYIAGRVATTPTTQGKG